ncbi:MAG: diguanylate cyclase [Magnetococcales bacterium]|nr:diguanylate cyclase [Magnetococcales bacterium]
MANTQRTLFGIRDHLNSETPNILGALSMIKNVLRIGACHEETQEFHRGTLFLLDEIILPLLATDRELESIIHRYAHLISQYGTLPDQDLKRFVAEIDAGLQVVQDSMMFPEGEPDIDIALLDKALSTTGYSEFPKNEKGELSTSWLEIHNYLATIVTSQKRRVNAVAQEESRRRRFLLDFTKGLASTSSRLDRSPDVINQLSATLDMDDAELNLAAISQVISQEIDCVGEQTAQVFENLETIDYTTKALGKLFNQADAMLLETEDSDLMDVVSGLPNRYGLMAKINQARLAIHEGADESFAVIFIGIIDLGRVRKKWGRERFSSLIRWLAGKIKESGSHELFRTASDGLAVFVPNANKDQVMDTAKNIKFSVLDHVVKQEKIPKEFHFGMGLVVAKPDMDEEAVLLAGSERMRRSILDDGKPTL